MPPPGRRLTRWSKAISCPPGNHRRHRFAGADGEAGSESWQVLSACKPHDCGHERIAVIWSRKANRCRVYSVVDETDQEKLTWLNVSDALSIDGKTALFAALSGSLDNHPDAFNYQ
jgi:hypothetical protein